MSKDLAIIMCPSLSDHPEQPKDQSHCEPFDCPKCKKQMWLSEKKKGVLLFQSILGNEILLACYHCFKKMVHDNPEFFREHMRVDI